MNIELKQAAQDAAALNWIERQHLEELGMGLVIDAPNDGMYYVCGDSGTTHYGKTLREALASAIQQAEAQQPATGIEIDFKQTTELLAMFGGEPATVTLMPGDGHRGKGLYAYYTDLPEEGAEFLGEADDEAVPDQQPATGEPEDFPAGAIVNGRTLMDRIEAYPFESEGGDLRMCSDWHELRRCFEHLADYVSPRPAPSVPEQTIDKICYLATEIRFAKSDDAAQAVIDSIRAMLAAKKETP